MIAIREGRETGIDGVRSLYPIGCIAALRRVERLEDGRFDLVTAGTERFRLNALDQTLPYLQGEIEPLGADAVDQAAAASLVRTVRAAFQRVPRRAHRTGRCHTVRVEDLPDEPVLLSYLVAAAMVVDLPEHQALLAEVRHHPRGWPPSVTLPVAGNRRAAGDHVAAAPRDLRYSPYSPNLAGRTGPSLGPVIRWGGRWRG